MSVPKYNIDELASQHERPGQFMYAFWEILAPVPETLLKYEEKVVLKAWGFDSTYGNGIRDQIANESYTIIVAGLKASKDLGKQRILEYTAVIESTFAEFNIGCGSVAELVQLERLSLDERDRLSRRLEEVEEPFEDEIWNDEIIVNAARLYMEKNRDVFLSRI